MVAVSPQAQEALDLARRGDTAGAIEAARKAISSQPEDYGLRLFIGMLHSRRMEFNKALPHVRTAVKLSPGDPLPRIELIRLLIALGSLDEAEAELSGAKIPGLEPFRLQAAILVHRQKPGQAAELLRQIVTHDPRDHESWGNLGACLLANGRPRQAVEPLARATQLRPDLEKYRKKWMEAQVEAGLGEEALENARLFASQVPGDPNRTLAVATLEDLLDRPDGAIETLHRLIARHPNHLPALVALAALHERLNQLDNLEDTIERIEQLDANAADLPLLRARMLFRRGELPEALDIAKNAPEAFDPGSRSELLGMINDRLGNHPEAFAMFAEMNKSGDLAGNVVLRRAAALREKIDGRARITTTEWVSDWTPAPPTPAVQEPAFVIGFPRSGTTLLDAFLMGHPDVCVAEEQPMLERVGEALDDYERLAKLTPAEVYDLRETYFAETRRWVPDIGERLLVDKNPFGAIDAAVIHRLFPDARIIFSQRHPYDVVLSCFFTRFKATGMLTSFSTLEDAALLYDRVLTLWEGCRTAMPLRVQELKYENLVANPEQELRQVVGFLGLEWHDEVTDHQKAARNRSVIQTASYAPVIEPIYDRSAGRWRNYREQLKPVLPLLAPWAERMGYDV